MFAPALYARRWHCDAVSVSILNRAVGVIGGRDGGYRKSSFFNHPRRSRAERLDRRRDGFHRERVDAVMLARASGTYQFTVHGLCLGGLYHRQLKPPEGGGPMIALVWVQPCTRITSALCYIDLNEVIPKIM